MSSTLTGAPRGDAVRPGLHVLAGAAAEQLAATDQARAARTVVGGLDADQQTVRYFGPQADLAAQIAPFLAQRLADAAMPDGTTVRQATHMRAEAPRVVADFARSGYEGLYVDAAGSAFALDAAGSFVPVAPGRAQAPLRGSPFQNATGAEFPPFAPSPAAAAPASVHEMRLGDFARAYVAQTKLPAETADAALKRLTPEISQRHRQAVTMELANGRPVPDAVLQDYRPDQLLLDEIAPDMAARFGYDLSAWLYAGAERPGEMWPRTGARRTLRASQERAQADGASVRAFALRASAPVVNLDASAGGFSEQTSRLVGGIVMNAGAQLHNLGANLRTYMDLIAGGRMVSGYREVLLAQGVTPAEAERRRNELSNVVLDGLARSGAGIVRYLDDGEPAWSVASERDLLPAEAVDPQARAAFLEATRAAPPAAPPRAAAAAGVVPPVDFSRPAQAPAAGVRPVDFSRAPPAAAPVRPAEFHQAAQAAPVRPVSFDAAASPAPTKLPETVMSVPAELDLSPTEESRRAVEEAITRLEAVRARNAGKPLTSADIRTELVDTDYIRSDGARDELVNRSLLDLVEATGIAAAPLAPGYMVFENPKTRKIEALPIETFVREAGPGGKLHKVFGDRQRALVETLVDWSGMAAENDPETPARMSAFARDVQAVVAEAAPHVTSKVVSRLFGNDEAGAFDTGTLGGSRSRVGSIALASYNTFLVAADPSMGSPVQAAYRNIFGLLNPLLREDETAAVNANIERFERAIADYEAREVTQELERRREELKKAKPGTVTALSIADRIKALEGIRSFGPASTSHAGVDANARAADVFARWATLQRGMSGEDRLKLDAALGAGPEKGAIREGIAGFRKAMQEHEAYLEAQGQDPASLQNKLMSISASAMSGLGRMLSVATGIGKAARELRSDREKALAPLNVFRNLTQGAIAQRRQEFDVGATIPAIQAQRIAQIAGLQHLSVSLNDAVKADRAVSALSIYQRLRYVHDDAKIREILNQTGFHVVTDREGRTTLTRDAREAEAAVVRYATRPTPELAGDGIAAVVSDGSPLGAKAEARSVREAIDIAASATRMPSNEWIEKVRAAGALMERTLAAPPGPAGLPAKATEQWVMPAAPSLGLGEYAVNKNDPAYRGADGRPDPVKFLQAVHAGLVKLAVEKNRFVGGSVIAEYQNEAWARAWTPPIIDQARAPQPSRRQIRTEKIHAQMGRTAGPDFAGVGTAQPAASFSAGVSFSAGAGNDLPTPEGLEAAIAAANAGRPLADADRVAIDQARLLSRAVEDAARAGADVPAGVRFSAGTAILGDGGGESIYIVPGAAMRRMRDGKVRAARDAVALIEGDNVRTVVGAGKTDAATARGLALAALEGTGEFHPMERLNAAGEVVARALVNTQGFRGAWEVQELPAGGHRLRLVERDQRLIEAGLFPTQTAAVAAAYQTDARMRALDARDPAWMQAASRYEIVQVGPDGILARTSVGPGRDLPLAERADVDMAAALVVAQESAIAETIKATVRPDLDTAAHLAAFQADLDAALGRAAPERPSMVLRAREAGNAVADFARRNPVAAGAIAAAGVAGAGTLAARLLHGAFSAGSQPGTLAVRLATTPDAAAKVGPSLRDIGGVVPVRMTADAQAPQFTARVAKKDIPRALPAIAGIDGVVGFATSDPTLPVYLAGEGGARARLDRALDAWQKAGDLRWSADRHSAEGRAATYFLRPTDIGRVERLFHVEAARSAQAVLRGESQIVTGATPLPLEFAREAVEQHAASDLSWQRDPSDGTLLSTHAFAGTYEVLPRSDGAGYELVFARRPGAPAPAGEALAFSAGVFASEAEAIAVASGDNASRMEAEQAARSESERPVDLHERRRATSTHYEILPGGPEERRYYDVHRVTATLTGEPVSEYETRGRTVEEARRKIHESHADQDPSTIRIVELSAAEAAHVRRRGAERARTAMRSIGEKAAAATGVGIVLTMAEEIESISQRLRNLEASRRQTEALDVGPDARALAQRLGAARDPASGAMVVPERADAATRDALLARFGGQAEAAAGRDWLSVEAGRGDIAHAMGAAFEPSNGRWYVPEGADPAVRDALRSTFSGADAEQAVAAARETVDQAHAIAFSAGAAELEAAGERPAEPLRKFERAHAARPAQPARTADRKGAEKGEAAPVPANLRLSPIGRSIGDELAAVPELAAKALATAAIRGAQAFKVQGDKAEERRAAEKNGAGKPVYGDVDVVSSRSAPAGNNAAEAPPAVVRAAAGAPEAPAEPVNYAKLVFKADVLRPKDTVALVERASALKPDELTLAWRITSQAVVEAQDTLRRAPSGTAKENAAALATGAAVLKDEAARRGIELPASAAPAAEQPQSTDRRRTRGDDRGR